MRVILRKWGNSAAVRIPRGIMEAAHLSVDEPVELHEQDGDIVIKPIRSGKSGLARLLRGINSENLHAEVDFGVSLGNESL